MEITTEMIKNLRELTGAGILECKKVLQDNDGDFEKAADTLRKQGLAVVAKKAERETKEGLVIVKTAPDAVCAVALACETDFVARTPDFRAFAHRLADQVLADSALTDATAMLAADFVDAPGKTVATVIQEMISKTGENILLANVARYCPSAQSLVEGYIHVGAVEGYAPQEGRVGVLVELRVEDAAVRASAAARDIAHDLALQIAALKPAYATRADIPEAVLAEKRTELLEQARAANKPEAIIAKIIEGQLGKFYQEICLDEQGFIREDEATVAEWLRCKSEELGTQVSVARFARLATGA
ncbi:MAG: translation elongation factor Ts [Anaerolineae bacterium]|nr:translation elongation factor Ts [Anaerolineae bacterium]